MHIPLPGRVFFGGVGDGTRILAARFDKGFNDAFQSNR